MSQSEKRIKEIPVGTKFGDLTVVSPPHRHTTGKTTRAMFTCICKCGRETKITGSQLRGGKRVRCTHCAYRERPQSTIKLSNLERMFNLSIISRCKRTKIKNLLTIEQYAAIISKDCYYCGEPPKLISHLAKNKIALREDFIANGIDRIDSSKDYTVDNCVACCKQCNTMKMSYTQEEFLNKIKIIYDKWIKQEDIIKEKSDMN